MLPDEQEQTTMTVDEYVKEVNELKKNSVPKEEYEKLLAEKKTLIKGMIDGNLPDDLKNQVENKQSTPDIKALRNKLARAGEEQLLNCEYVETALQLRAAIIAKGDPDPFLPQGVKTAPTLEDLKGAERVADGLQYCIDNSRDESGRVDPDLFNARLKSIIAEDSPTLSARLKAKNRRK